MIIFKFDSSLLSSSLRLPVYCLNRYKVDEIRNGKGKVKPNYFLLSVPFRFVLICFVSFYGSEHSLFPVEDQLAPVLFKGVIIPS